MKNRLVIIGAGGHGKVIADIALKVGYQNIVFLDDAETGERMGFPIVGTSDDIMSMDDEETDFVIAIGDNHTRQRLAIAHDVNWVTLIHPGAVIGAGVQIGKGTVVMAMAVLNPDAVVGEHCIINTGAIVEHDNVIGDYVHLSPRVALGGTVHVGKGTHVGIGATVRNNINICDTCVIGAGSVIVKDIEVEGTYVGVPGRKIK